MVTCNLVGRMANQMFTIAATVAYALRHGMEYHIPAHTLNDQVWKPIFTNLENKNYDPSLTTTIIREKTHAYQEIPFMEEYRNMNVIIDGYRQSAKYFEDYIDEVRRVFGFSYSSAVSDDAVLLHVRLGDYKLYPTKHLIVTDKYIKNALSLFEKMGYKRCLVFSDEISWCIENINEAKYPKFSFRYAVGDTEVDDFQRMLLHCNAYIISASTYSLMASILSTSPVKVVVAPYEWFGEGNKNLDTKDICPDDYLRLKF